MENIIIKKTVDGQGRITGLEIGGRLVLEYSQELKKGFAGVIDCLSDRVKITVLNTAEIDLSCIQLFVAFIKHLMEPMWLISLNGTLMKINKLYWKMWD